MKPLVLADSSFCIFAGRDLGNPFRYFSLHEATHEFATCGVVTVEVLRGVAAPKLMDFWKRGFSRLTYLPTEQSTWEIARQVAWRLERAGRRLGTPDIIIAACAIESRAMVLTRDKRFSEIGELTVISSLEQ